MLRYILASMLILSYCIFLSKEESHIRGFESSEIKIPALIKNTSRILCTLQAKTLYVYVDKHISFGIPSYILKALSNCGVSYISMRSRGIFSPLPAVKDDGVRMYLLMVLQKATHFIEVSIIQKYSAAKHLSHAMIVIENSSAITEQWLKATFMKFWHKWFPNVAILFSRDDSLHIYRYNPFARNVLIRVMPKGSLPHIEELFPRKIPNMERKPFRVCLFNDNIRAIFQPHGQIMGTDGIMSKFIAERLNATRLVNRVSTYGYENKTADLCFREIATALDDVALNTRFLSLPVFYKRVEPTIVLSRDDLCVLVPKSKIASTFWNLFRAYNITVWCCILMSILLAYSFFHYTHLQDRRFRRGLLLQLYAGSLTLPFMHPPKKLSLRFFLFCWLFYGLLICGAFRGTLTSNLVFRTFLPDIDTLQDLARSPYRIALIPRHMKHLYRFLNLSNPNEAMIERKLTVLPDKLLVDSIESNNMTYAFIHKRHVAVYQQTSRRHVRNGRPLYHVMENCLVPFHAVYIVPYGYPHLGAINSLIRSSREFGLVNYWERVMKSYGGEGRARIPKGRSDGDPVVLNLPHFQAAFCIWALGLLLAFCVFLWEMFRQKHSSSTCIRMSKRKISKEVKTMQKRKQRENYEKLSFQKQHRAALVGKA